jgi:hypothetical protein
MARRCVAGGVLKRGGVGQCRQSVPGTAGSRAYGAAPGNEPDLTATVGDLVTAGHTNPGITAGTLTFPHTEIMRLSRIRPGTVSSYILLVGPPGENPRSIRRFLTELYPPVLTAEDLAPQVNHERTAARTLSFRRCLRRRRRTPGCRMALQRAPTMGKREHAIAHRCSMHFFLGQRHSYLDE